MGKTNMNALFGGIKRSKPDDRSYQFIQKAMDRRDISGTCDLSHLAKWLKHKYKYTYNKEMLGYNFYNCRKVIQALANRYSKTNWQICTYINKWFLTFHTLGYDKVAYDNTLTLAVLKTDWIVDGLFNNELCRKYKSSSRNKSYRVHSTARRQVSNNDEIVDEKF